MSEKSQLSLSDLGVEKVLTPAEEAEQKAANESKIETVDPSKLVIEEETKTEEEEKPKIVTPKTAGKVSGNVIRNINSIATKPITDKMEEDLKKVQDARNGLYKLADENIERTKVEILPRIEEGKRAYIQQQWEIIERKSRTNKSLAKKVQYLNDLMDSDVRFDDADDYLRHGYIVTFIASNSDTGLDPNFFSKDVQNRMRRFRNSKDANEEIDAMVNKDKEDDGTSIYDDSVTTSLNKNDNDALPVRDTNKKEEEESQKIELDEEESIFNDDDFADEQEATESEDISLEVKDDDDDEIDYSKDEDFQKEIIRKYKDDIKKELANDEEDDIEEFTVSSKAIKISSVINNHVERKSSIWGLQYSGIPIEMVPFSGEDLMTLNPRQTDYTTIAGLRSVFSTLYRHIVNPHKPDFEDWLKQTSDNDTDCIIFAVYVANFKDTNILTHECENPKCGNVFIKKYSIDDLVVYPNDKVKNRFKKILQKNTEMTDLYRTKPIVVNKDYAFEFMTQSIYSSIFEPMTLSEDDRKKYAPILSITPVLNKIYKIDRTAKALYPISFGNGKTLEATIIRKIKGITQIMKKFSPDERSIVISEATKIINSLNEDKITYQIPETICPHCGKVIEKKQVTPLDLLFMRAQLPIIAASIQE